MVIDVLLGRNIFGESTYVQVTNMDGLLGKFNSILMNKILVMVDEVSMSKKEAEQVKGMITGENMNFKKKGLDKIVLKNHMDFIFTSTMISVSTLIFMTGGILFLMLMTPMLTIKNTTCNFLINVTIL